MAASDKQTRKNKYLANINKRPYTSFERQLIKRRDEMLKKCPKPGSWVGNFKKFYDKHNYPGLNRIDPQTATYINHGIIPNNPIYVALKDFAMTKFGASIVHEILSKPKKYGGFVLVVGKPSLPQTAAGDGLIRFKPGFPIDYYRVSGQMMYAAGTIYHEFGHSNIFETSVAGGHTVEHEAAVCRVLENPMRLARGFEARYSYTTLDGTLKTVNVITGKWKGGRYRVRKDNPMELVKMDDPNAFRL